MVFQSPKIENENLQLIKNLKKECQKQSFKIIKALMPKTIFTIGFKVFDIINNTNACHKIEKFKNGRIFQEGSLGNSIPVFGCPHITGAYFIDKNEIDRGIKFCFDGIKKIIGKEI